MHLHVDALKVSPSITQKVCWCLQSITQKRNSPSLSPRSASMPLPLVYGSGFALRRPVPPYLRNRSSATQRYLSHALEISSPYSQMSCLSQTLSSNHHFTDVESQIHHLTCQVIRGPLWLLTPCKLKAPLPGYPLHCGIAEFRFFKWKVTLYSQKCAIHCHFGGLTSYSLHVRFNCTLYFI